MSLLKAGFMTSLPAICGFLGGVLGGMLSDGLIRRGVSLTLARKIPIVGGMALSMVIIGCNYVDSEVLVIVLMAVSFFGKGIGSLGWAVVADTAPKEAIGLSGSLFNMFGNTAGIIAPIAIGYLVGASGVQRRARVRRAERARHRVQLSRDREGHQTRRTASSRRLTFGFKTKQRRPHENGRRCCIRPQISAVRSTNARRAACRARRTSSARGTRAGPRSRARTSSSSRSTSHSTRFSGASGS